MPEPVIVEAVRTPFGRRGGALREQRPDSLLAHAIDGLLDRAGVDPARIGDVIDGTVTLAGEQAANPARLAVLLSRLPSTVPGVSLNRMCGSSQQSVHFAAQAVAAGDMDYVIGCGVESMTRVPMFLDLSLGQPNQGFERLNPELFRRHELIHQGESAERVALKWQLSREALDDFSKESHRRAAAAQAQGLNRELLPTPGVSAQAQTIVLDRDEGVRAVIDEAKMQSLKPAFRAEGKGVITAANSSQISDGASAVLIASLEAAKADGLRPRARFLAKVVVGDDPTMQLMGVIPATRIALQRAGIGIRDLDWIEINEAFAAVVLSWARDLDPDMQKEMDRCRREGTPRPESSAVRAHVPAAFWAFANSWRDLFKNGVCDHAIKEMCRLYVSGR